MKYAIADHIRKIAEKEPPNIELWCNDTENSLAKLLSYIMYVGNIGHSFDIVVDPDNKEYKMSFGWDGDGADGVRNIKIDGKKVGFKDFFEKDKDKSEKFLTVFKKKSR